jgi:hypothetical protein
MGAARYSSLALVAMVTIRGTWLDMAPTLTSTLTARGSIILGGELRPGRPSSPFPSPFSATILLVGIARDEMYPALPGEGEGRGGEERGEGERWRGDETRDLHRKTSE